MFFEQFPNHRLNLMEAIKLWCHLNLTIHLPHQATHRPYFRSWWATGYSPQQCPTVKGPSNDKATARALAKAWRPVMRIRASTKLKPGRKKPKTFSKTQGQNVPKSSKIQLNSVFQSDNSMSHGSNMPSWWAPPDWPTTWGCIARGSRWSNHRTRRPWFWLGCWNQRLTLDRHLEGRGAIASDARRDASIPPRWEKLP